MSFIKVYRFIVPLYLRTNIDILAKSSFDLNRCIHKNIPCHVCTEEVVTVPLKIKA